ncbi:DEAD/DEAH box helicase [Chitinophaga nivalis]|uniref:DNA 3'-5' helicase n=1 Tax=Chitinophaga nivalis TaxID=2991709 RepID=A0ABT3IS87_9BACT|nr:DEAD/DEAH box helicase [Chitinophaga nivalis]MCW3463484.1 DEAD/DEAH box helicase [Chitinophaga nivalis]MCW3486826.1 DEAD/DEAH box helicase [Chitinophaga nivalis]
MIKFTANYSYTNPNFVVQNLVTQPVDSPYLSVYYVIKNILQRGCPTMLSEHLQQHFGKDFQQRDDFKTPFLLIDTAVPVWQDTIKGDKQKNYYPAKTFFEKLIPDHFGEYAFIQALLLPEAEINDIVQEYNETFVGQAVDFFLPQAKMVIEIDGQQHKRDDRIRVQDNIRDTYLAAKGVTTFRIPLKAFNDGSFVSIITDIKKFLALKENKLQLYRTTFQQLQTHGIDPVVMQEKLLPTAIMRLQLLILELLINGQLSIAADTWQLHLQERDVSGFASLALQDLLMWLAPLCQLRKLPFTAPRLDIQVTTADGGKMLPKKGYVNIDFSLLKRYTDEHLHETDTLFVRTDYFGSEQNYFVASTTSPVTYAIINDDNADQSALRFFLKNIFDKDDFREGQFAIIANALSRWDTIGLLPTGGGKSICYQLACLLQPSINFVVSPIKSLMYDQQDNVKSLLITNTGFITGDLPPEEKERVQREFSQGKYLFIWISPERFQIKSFREYLAAVNSRFSIAYAVIDEVHCLSEWGHDFRTSYLNLARTIQQYCRDARFIGLTATASVHVLKDIRIEFQIKDENVKTLKDYSRKELQFEVIADKGNKLELLKNKLHQLNQVADFIGKKDKAALIFSPNVNGPFGCYELANYINTLYPDQARFYSGEVPVMNEYDDQGRKTNRKIPVMPPEEFTRYKNEVQHQYKHNKFPLLAATKAFGMGIDKQNIHYTIHYGIPGSVESLYQEAGRAGRWNKSLPENQDVVARCLVLHSHETVDPQLVDEIFDVNTDIARIAEINKEVGFSGKDIFKIIFLFLQGHKEITEDFILIRFLIDHYFKADSIVKVFWRDAIRELATYSQQHYGKLLTVKETEIQKGIYKLSLLGIVKDWTTDFVNLYEVSFHQMQEAAVLYTLTKYIHKYEPTTNVEEQVRMVKKDNLTDQCICFLLQWTWDNIVYKRRQSIKTLSDWCLDFRNSEFFKQRIDTYFQFTETTFILQHIAEHPKEYAQWFELFYHHERLIDAETAARLRDGLSRFLESYRSNVGLNVISGLVRLLLQEFDDTDGRPRLENALAQFPALFTTGEQQQILARIIALGCLLPEESRYTLAETLVPFYPDQREYLAEELQVIYLLDRPLKDNIITLKKLNLHLYEQLTKI